MRFGPNCMLKVTGISDYSIFLIVKQDCFIRLLINNDLPMQMVEIYERYHGDRQFTGSSLKEVFYFHKLQI